MSKPPLVPRNVDLSNAIHKSMEKPAVITRYRGKSIRAFNGSVTSKRNKKRPITLATKA